MLAPLRPEPRKLIAGRLASASNGGIFQKIKPATEEVLGSCADGTKDDPLAAIAAARRAFDETSDALPGSPPHAGPSGAER